MKELKVEATKKLKEGGSLATRVRRAAFNSSKSGDVNLFGENKLVEDVASGCVPLGSIAKEHLPAAIQALAPAKQHAVIKEKATRRDELKREITAMTEQCAAFLKDKVAEIGGADESLDAKMYGTVRQQAAKKGLHYECGCEADAPAY